MTWRVSLRVSPLEGNVGRKFLSKQVYQILRSSFCSPPSFFFYRRQNDPASILARSLVTDRFVSLQFFPPPSLEKENVLGWIWISESDWFSLSRCVEEISFFFLSGKVKGCFEFGYFFSSWDAWEIWWKIIIESDWEDIPDRAMCKMSWNRDFFLITGFIWLRIIRLITRQIYSIDFYWIFIDDTSRKIEV